ncbi:hypothetical protein [Phycicoccus sp.]|uniref:hypothetical protein n=1 Tax=Phycicoccus sp. TaxID=1902410 RepID=UPI002C460C60|nr:hypothetical protein [Phycicoccus sp.]HMM95105.1 hypothetical protein [Phycicoccus sp.]
MLTLTNDPTLGTTSTIGRYFGVVSVVPSFFFTVWSYLLLVSQPWEGPPDLSGLTTETPAEAAALGLGLILTSLVIAVVTHPLQFLAVQALEGYWGPGALGSAMQERHIARHLRRRQQLEESKDYANDRVRRTKGGLGLKAGDDLNWADVMDAGGLAPLLGASVQYRATKIALGTYPQLHENVMPTRLGNVLRKYEGVAGGAVGLDLILWANHIGMVAEPSQTAYVQDQRNAMDLAVRMVGTCLAMFGLTFVLYWPHGVWLLVALLPLCGAFLSYRGAVAAADSYGRALSAWIQLNRFRLYEALQLPPVRDAQEERDQNRDLEDLALGQPEYRAAFRRAATVSGPAALRRASRTRR